MPLNPSGAISLAGPVAGQSIAVELGQSATATISLNDTNVRTLAQKPSGVIVMPTDFWGKSNITGTQRAIFGFGIVPSASPAAARVRNVTNLVSSSGVVASDTPGVGTARSALAAATYGGDKAIFGYGVNPSLPQATRNFNMSNLVSNTGVVAADTPGVGTARSALAAAGYGTDKSIFGFGNIPVSPFYSNVSNLVSNTGVVASDSPGVGTNRDGLAAAGYGGDKAIFAFGFTPVPSPVTITNLVSNTGVVASDTTTSTGVVRYVLRGAGYGGDKAIVAFGQADAPLFSASNASNLISNTGVIASDTPGVGTARTNVAGAIYGSDKAIFGYGFIPGTGNTTITNLVSNTGVVAANTPGAGTARTNTACAGYSLTA